MGDIWNSIIPVISLIIGYLMNQHFESKKLKKMQDKERYERIKDNYTKILANYLAIRNFGKISDRETANGIYSTVVSGLLDDTDRSFEVVEKYLKKKNKKTGELLPEDYAELFDETLPILKQALKELEDKL